MKKPVKTAKARLVTEAAKKEPKAIEKKTDGEGNFYIAGIGGSAGSLEALESFFKNLPPNTGVGYVIVQHLDPTHKDILPELLQRCTEMKVLRAEEDLRVRPNCVYVIPPNKEMSIMHGRLRLVEPSMPRGLRMPIDIFFKSLADDKEESAIGIILSGMGADGTLGVKALKQKLGMVMVQSVESAKYDGMPKSAMETDVVDITAPADLLPKKLVGYIKHLPAAMKGSAMTSKQATGALQRILLLLRNQTSHDFSFYKKNTIYRRIERRMGVHQLDTIAKYLRFLQIHPEEIDSLFKELLIGVTNFFRDPDAFKVFKEKALPALFKAKPKKSIVRVWTVGCSTGEEAYSLAMVIKEHLIETKQENDFRVQVFATDIDKTAIERARQGQYPSNITADLSDERLRKFFFKEDSIYRVKKEIREMIVFAPQNVINDPPFTKLDILCCRNLLIYLTHEIQKKIMPLFHYALNPSGVLFLGSSETIGSLSELFTAVDSKWKIFTRKEALGDAKLTIDMPVLPSLPRRKAYGQKERKGAGKVPQVAVEKLLEEFAPPSVFISEQGDILYVSGRTGKYLEPAAGEANLNAFAMAREGLRFELASAVRKAANQKQEVIVRDLKVRTNGSFQTINLIVKPFTKPESLQGVLMVVFEDVIYQQKRSRRVELKVIPSAKQKSIIAELEQELKYTKEHLQTTVEEMETSQEELKSANEELTTSKEEMQSLNEELITVNAELQNKVDELSRANNDMKNLLNSTELATIFLDNDLNVKRFTAPTTKIINLIPSDVGRPIAHIVSNLKYESLSTDVHDVLKSLVFREVQVETKAGSWYLMRIIPYRTFENVIDGVVVTFTEISDFKKLEQSLRESQDRCKELIEELKTK